MDFLESTCLMCPRMTSWHCPCSKEAKYCSSTCQVLDYPVHKQFCSTLAEFQLLRSSRLRRCVFFPGGSEQGRFVWAEVDDGPQGQILDGDPFFRLSRTCIRPCIRNLVQGRYCQRDPLEQIQIISLANPSTREINQGLCNVARAGKISNCFRGPVLLTRTQNAGRVDQQYVDLDMRDIRNAADFVSCYNRKNSNTINHYCTVTFASSLGDLEYSMQPDFLRQDMFSKDRDEAYQNQGSTIANILGIPIQPLKRKYHQIHKHKYRPEQLINSYSANLMLDISSVEKGSAEVEVERNGSWSMFKPVRPKFGRLERGTEGFGTPPASATNQGGIGFVRTDGKVLLPEHLEALCSYVSCKVAPRVQEALGAVNEGETVIGRDEIFQHTTKADFLNFWSTLRIDNEWDDVPSPYDV